MTMKVENLIIERKPNYDTDYPNQLVGLVQIKGEHGKMEVKLSNDVVGKIFALIRDDVQRVANYNSSQSGFAVDEVAAEHMLPSPIEQGE
jgi:hypothetical protein